MSEIIKPPPTTNNSLAPALSCIGNKTIVKFNGGCLKQDKITFTHGANIYIVYEINLSDSNNNYPTLKNCLFGAVELNKKS